MHLYTCCKKNGFHGVNLIALICHVYEEGEIAKF